MNCSISIITLCTLILCTTSFADEVYLKNGDRLSGQIVRVTDSKLVLKSQAAGEVTVNLADVKTFSSEQPLEIHLKDGTVLNQPAAAAEPNEFALKTGEPLKAQTFSLAQVASINPPAAPKPKWTGSLSAAVSATSGNTKTSSITGSVNLTRRSEKDRTIFEADIAKSHQTNRTTGEGETTEDWWRILAQYDYFFTKKLFGFGNFRYEKDGIALLERRVVVGGGAGYQWIESDKLAFSTNLGIASLFEKYENAPETSNELTLQAGYRFNWELWKNTRFINELTYYPSFDDISDYFLTTTAELRTNLTKAMFANFKVIFNYDSTPAPGRGNTDVKYILGVGINF
jgi:putative salt-induced outer membrane protein YdiY